MTGRFINVKRFLVPAPVCTGDHRVDDRRVISGIACTLKSGARWRDYPRDHGRVTGHLGLINQSLLRIARLTTMLRVSQADISGWE